MPCRIGPTRFSVDGIWVACGFGRAALPNPQATQIPSTEKRVGPMRHGIAEHVAFADRQGILRGHGERLRNVEVGAAPIERYVEAVEGRRETVALAARGG